MKSVIVKSFGLEGEEKEEFLKNNRKMFIFEFCLAFAIGSFIIGQVHNLINSQVSEEKVSKQETLIPVEWGDALGSDDIAGIMAGGYSNWMVAPYVTLMVAAENKTEKANSNLELHMFTFNIPTTLKVCQKNKDVSMGAERVNANGVVLQADVKCGSGWINYHINEEGTQGSATPLDTMLRTKEVTLTFPDDGVFTFSSTGYAAWVDNKLTQQYVRQAKEDEENLRLNKFYAMHEAKVNDAQGSLAKLFWCEDMGYNMNRFTGLAEKMQGFAVNHSHPKTYQKNREKLESQYSTWPQSVARDVCPTAGHTRYTY
ncbi:MAG: hypothetical protein ABJM39_09545 [Porticoccus sp.]|jgi:hypothetical protein|uniref:hypothetical protein n=1 Tax=Porticoccus sp. TaxID=2024853 RepID=UPI0032995C0F